MCESCLGFDVLIILAKQLTVLTLAYSCKQESCFQSLEHFYPNIIECFTNFMLGIIINSNFSLKVKVAGFVMFLHGNLCLEPNYASFSFENQLTILALYINYMLCSTCLG